MPARPPPPLAARGAARSGDGESEQDEQRPGQVELLLDARATSSGAGARAPSH